MKPWHGWTRDPAFHLISVVAIVLTAALALKAQPWGATHRQAVKHPASCHACSLCSPEVAAVRDAYLIRTGTIAPEDGSE